MKNIFVLLTLVIATLTASAQSYVSAAVTAATNNVISTPCTVENIAVTTGTNAATLTFYDNNAAANTYSNAAYYSYSLTATTNTTYITNAFSYVVTNLDVGYKYTITTNAASTNVLPILYMVTLPSASASSTPVQIPFSKGVTYKSTANDATLVIQYRR